VSPVGDIRSNFCWATLVVVVIAIAPVVVAAAVLPALFLRLAIVAAVGIPSVLLKAAPLGLFSRASLQR